MGQPIAWRIGRCPSNPKVVGSNPRIEVPSRKVPSPHTASLGEWVKWREFHIDNTVCCTQDYNVHITYLNRNSTSIVIKLVRPTATKHALNGWSMDRSITAQLQLGNITPRIHCLLHRPLQPPVSTQINTSLPPQFVIQEC